MTVLRDRLSSLESTVRERTDGYYLVLLVVLALCGQLFASYDFNLLVLTIPDTAGDLHISATQVGLIVFFIYAGELVVTMTAGYAMDQFGRKRVWQLNLVGTAVFTGLTYFVADYWELLQRYEVDVDELDQPTVRQLFARPDPCAVNSACSPQCGCFMPVATW